MIRKCCPHGGKLRYTIPWEIGSVSVPIKDGLCDECRAEKQKQRAGCKCLNTPKNFMLEFCKLLWQKRWAPGGEAEMYALFTVLEPWLRSPTKLR